MITTSNCFGYSQQLRQKGILSLFIAKTLNMIKNAELIIITISSDISHTPPDPKLTGRACIMINDNIQIDGACIYIIASDCINPSGLYKGHLSYVK